MGAHHTKSQKIRIENLYYRYFPKKDVQFFRDEAMINEICAKTNLKRADIDAWYQGFMRDCPSGKLDEKLLEKTYQKLFPDGNSKEYARAAFAAYDKDKNGYIEFHEFINVIAILLSDNVKEKISLIFEIFDQNNDGIIERKEAYTLLSSIYKMHGDEHKPKYIEKQVDNLFKKFDKDGNGVLSMDEFIDGCCENEDIKNLVLINH